MAKPLNNDDLFDDEDTEEFEDEEDSRCPECGAALGPDDLVCPQCGAEFEFYCPQCGEDIPADATVCPHCGTMLEDAWEDVEEEALIGADDGDGTGPTVERAEFCANCGGAITDEDEECPTCGVDLCPDCGSPLGADDTLCLNCGAEFLFSCPNCGQDLPASADVCPACGFEFEGYPLEEEEAEDE